MSLTNPLSHRLRCLCRMTLCSDWDDIPRRDRAAVLFMLILWCMVVAAIFALTVGWLDTVFV